MKYIRNFAIIAHIDHGKSTLADRIMEICGAVDEKHQEQLLDSLELEREHGITIKLKAIRLNYKEHILNLIDTPGHVDFAYEVSRSLVSVEGALLVVDATQGVQAQTLANFDLSLEADLTLIPIINKIDSPQANVEKTEKELEDLGFTKTEIIKVSAKTGENVEKVLQTIIEKIPFPKQKSSEKPGFVSESTKEKAWLSNKTTQALIFDSSLDPFKGVIATIRLFGGEIKKGDEVMLSATKSRAEILQVGYLTPKPKLVNNLSDGEVGFIVTNIKNISKVKVGDTITSINNPAHPPTWIPRSQTSRFSFILSHRPT